jgi:hypothetical protein
VGKQKLTIITPVTRPDNLYLIYPTLPWHWFDLTWICVMDDHCSRSRYDKIFGHGIIWEHCHDPLSVYGNAQRNMALDKVFDGLIYFLDDDTIMHPLFGPIVNGVFEEQKPGAGLLCAQLRNRGRMVASVDPIEVGQINTGQMVIRRDWIAALRWKTDEYRADGYFITTLYKANPKAWIKTDTVLALDNWLR